jgi:hypothetical protein
MLAKAPGRLAPVITDGLSLTAPARKAALNRAMFQSIALLFLSAMQYGAQPCYSHRRQVTRHSAFAE